MTINRSALRRDSTRDLLNKVKNATQNNSFKKEDDRIWKLTTDANGNGFATIRLLPAKNEDQLPFVKRFDHGFKSVGGWFIENCPTSIGEECPVCQSNRELWNSGFEDDKKKSSERKRRLKYYANIIVIKDPKNPQNEGKNFIWSFGKKIMDKIQAVMNPPAEYDEEPRDPFSFFDGCVIKLKQKQIANFPNLDDTTIEPATDLFGGDEDQLMELLENMYDLEEAFIDPKHFKSFEELKHRFDKVVGSVPSSKSMDEDAVEEYAARPAKEYGSSSKMDALRAKKAPAPVVEEEEEVAPPPKKAAAPVEVASTSDEDDDLEYFKKLMDEE